MAITLPEIVNPITLTGGTNGEIYNQSGVITDGIYALYVTFRGGIYDEYESSWIASKGVLSGPNPPYTDIESDLLTRKYQIITVSLDELNDDNEPITITWTGTFKRFGVPDRVVTLTRTFTYSGINFPYFSGGLNLSRGYILAGSSSEAAIFFANRQNPFTWENVETNWETTAGSLLRDGSAAIKRTITNPDRRGGFIDRVDFVAPDEYEENIVVTWTGKFNQSNRDSQTLRYSQTVKVNTGPVVLPPDDSSESIPQYRPGVHLRTTDINYDSRGRLVPDGSLFNPFRVSGSSLSISTARSFQTEVIVRDGGDWDTVTYQWSGDDTFYTISDPTERVTQVFIGNETTSSYKPITCTVTFEKPGAESKSVVLTIHSFTIENPTVRIEGPRIIANNSSEIYRLTAPTSTFSVDWTSVIVPQIEDPDSSLEPTTDGGRPSVRYTPNLEFFIINGVASSRLVEIDAGVKTSSAARLVHGLINIHVTPDQPTVDAPAYEIKGVRDIEQGQTLSPTADVADGGKYDEIDYLWGVIPSDAGTFDDPTSENPTFTASHHDEIENRHGVKIRADLTFRGTGTEAYDNTYVIGSETSDSFTITAHNADGPDIEVTGLHPVVKGDSITLTPVLSEGVYDKVLSYDWDVENVDDPDSEVELGEFGDPNSETGVVSFTATRDESITTNTRAKIRVTAVVERNYRGRKTTAVGRGEANFAILTTRPNPVLNENADDIRIVGNSVPLTGSESFSVEITHKENIYEFSAYDELEYSWTLVSPIKGTLATENDPTTVFTANELGDQEIKCTLTPVGTGGAATNGRGGSITITKSIDIFDSELVDRLNTGTWKEIPKPGIQYKLDPSTLPLIAEHKDHQTMRDTWKFSSEIEDDNESSKRRQFWEDRKAGDELTVPNPSFIDRKIKDLNFAQNRLVFLTTDSVVTSFAGVHGLFWGASAGGTIPADPIDLDIGNSVAAECLSAQGQNLWILTPEQQYALYPADDSGGWTPQNMRIDKMAQISIELDLRIWSDGSLVCGGHPNGLILDLSLDIRAVQPLDISARVSDLLSKPRLTPKEIKEGKYQWKKENSEVIARCFLPSTNTQIALQRERLPKNYDTTDPNRELLRTRLLITRQIRETFCWSHCSFEECKRDEEDNKTWEFNYEIMTITQHQENLYMLVRDRDGGIHLESLYLGDQDREEDCCDHRIIGEEENHYDYRSCVQFSAPVLYENAYGELTPTRNTNFNVKSYVIHFKPKEDEDFEFKVISTPNGREPNITTYNNIALGYSKEPFLRRDVPEWDSFEVPCNYEAKFFNVCIESYSKIPFEILSGEWSALISGPERRRR